GADWVSPITAEDLAAYQQSVVTQITNFGEMIATAMPPKNETAYATPTSIPEFEMASNGWAIGAERSASGRGMLVANPHYPWVGSNRFWEKHLVIPGKLDIYGVGLLGSPTVAIGFNKNVAWTHTVSAGKRFTLYSLDLAPGNPTRYLYDGKEREMTSKVISIAVKQTDGTLKQVERRIFFSHYGPIVNVPGFGWTAKRAVTVRDANSNNTSSQTQWMAMAQARNLDEFKKAHADYNALPWVNTIATSSDGRAWYADTSGTPNLKPEAIAALLKRKDSDMVTKMAWDRGMILLDGSNSLFEYVNDPATRAGAIPYSRMPQLERKDYVFNANDSFWLANPHQLLTGFSPLQGLEGTSRTLRTRMNALLLDDKSAGGPSGADGKFTLDELAAAALSNRSLSAELLRAEVVKRCQATSSITLEGKAVDLTKACGILAAWDGRFNNDSIGAVLWREFTTQYEMGDLQKAGVLFQTDFNAADAVNTPHTMTPDKNNDSLIKLAKAISVMEKAGFALNAPLGKVQYSNKNPNAPGRRIPIHGGGAYEGIANIVSTSSASSTLEPNPQPERMQGSRFLTKEGYLINYGTSFIMALEYTSQGPRAQAFLTYSQSGDPASPQFYDQTQLFSEKKWRRILFTEAEIKSDPNLKTVKVTSGK
ncbi:MAG: acylase, partial [Acidobacteria bacterium]|nr:acylase [Acidobacteriota bacterium]